MSTLLSVNKYHYRRGGSEIAYFNHAGLLEGAGWNNTFFSMKHPRNIPDKYDYLFAECMDYEGDMTRRQKIIGAVRTIYSVEAAQKLRRLLEISPVKIAHVHSIYHHLSPSILVELRRRDIPVVMTLHDLKIACPNYKMLNSTGICERCRGGKVWNVLKYRCMKDSFSTSALIMLESAIHKMLDVYGRHVSMFVVPSLFYRVKLIEWGWPEEKLIYIPNSVGQSTQVSISQPGKYIVYFGRLSPEKGLKTLVCAAGKSQIPVLIVGTGPEEASLRALATEYNAPVSFAGYLTGSDLHQAVDGSAAVVLPSEWYENAPLSVLEAYNQERPVIGANIGGIPEMIEHGETGWVFTSGSVTELADTMKIAVGSSSSKLAAMGRAGKDLGAQKYSPEKYLAEVLNLYSSLGIS